MKINILKHPPRWILFTGLIFWLIGNVVLGTLFKDLQNVNDPIVEWINALTFSIVVLFIIIIIPILEEIAFRGWLSKWRWLKVLSLLLMMGFVYMWVPSIWICLPLELILAYLIFSPSSHNKRIVTIVLFSLIFGIGHWSNYSVLEVQIIALCVTFGLGLVFSYISWRYGLIWAIILHILNNALAFMMGDFDQQTTHHHVIANERYQVEFGKPSIISFISEEESFSTEDSFKYAGELGHFALIYFETYLNDSNVIYHFNQKISDDLINVSIKFNEPSKESYIEAFDAILAKKNFVLDTIWRPTYDIDWSEEAHSLTLYPSIDTDQYITTNLYKMKVFKWQLSFGIPFKVNPNDSQIVVKYPLYESKPVHPNSNLLFESYNSIDFFQIMKDNNIALSVDSNTLVPVLSIRKM